MVRKMMKMTIMMNRVKIKIKIRRNKKNKKRNLSLLQLNKMNHKNQEMLPLN